MSVNSVYLQKALPLYTLLALKIFPLFSTVITNIFGKKLNCH